MAMTSQGIGNYWKSNVWMEMIANDLFVNDDAKSTPSMECDDQPSYSELEVQSFVEIQEESSSRRAKIDDDGSGSGGGIVSMFFDDPDYTRADENICPAVDLSRLELNNVDTDLEELLKDSPSETLSRTDDARRVYSNKRKANSTHDFLEMLGPTNDVFRDDLNVEPNSIVATSTPKKMNLTEASNESSIEPMFGKKNLSITEILWQRLCADRSIDSLDSIEPSSISGGCEISAVSENKKIDDIANDKVDTFDSKQLQEQIDTNLYEITIPSPLSLSENKSNGILDLDEYLPVSTTSDEVINPNYPGTIEQSIYQSNLFSDESVLQRFGERLNKYKTQNQQLHFDTDWENEIDLVSRVSKFIQNRLDRKSANDVDQVLPLEKKSEGKVSTDNNSKINESAESKKGDVSQNSEEPSKKKYAKKPRLSNDNNVCNNKSSVITDENFEDERRITRQFVKQIDDVRKSLKKIDYAPGRLVWAHYRSVWWPAIIIRAEDAGMVSTPKNVWVIWIGELLISNHYARTSSTSHTQSSLDILTQYRDWNAAPGESGRESRYPGMYSSMPAEGASGRDEREQRQDCAEDRDAAERPGRDVVQRCAGPRGLGGQQQQARAAERRETGKAESRPGATHAAARAGHRTAGAAAYGAVEVVPGIEKKKRTGVKRLHILIAGNDGDRLSN
ncbi:unnamed protein product [Trichogramma brassicae]|uniref:PWWP domain-containing protein n=1 Tax=Trichogramma brassicae TaxID=86971 RepID=A0A6H5J4G2_9HYME|nr:unnamed protein product [Trichogramma brassicae]